MNLSPNYYIFNVNVKLNCLDLTGQILACMTNIMRHTNE